MKRRGATLTLGVAAVALTMGVASVRAAAQERGTATVRGRVVHSVTLAPVASASVLVEETGAQTTAAADGTFSFVGLPPGDCHFLVVAPGFLASRNPVRLAPGANDVKDLAVDPELHYSEVVSVGPTPRDQFESYQPAEALTGDELAKALGIGLGDTVSGQAGISERSFGPGPARPVIRGLDGDRVLILEDGQRMGDLSAQSADHGVNVNPAAAERIEIIRGPATLLYGANAIGGLVNVINESVPTRRVSGTSGSLTFDVGSGAAEAGAAGDVLWGDTRWAVRASGSVRGSGDVKTPDGTVDNSQTRAAFASVGASWTGERAFAGGSYAWDDSRFGVPVVEGGQVESTPRRQSVSLRAGASGLTGFLEGYRASFGYRHYRHDEVVAKAVETAFRNVTAEGDLRVNHRALGRMKGTWGGWAYGRAFDISGEEALSPPVDQRTYAGFVYEELDWSHVTVQFGGRYDWTGYTPEGGLPPRDFGEFSGSVGVLYEPHAARGNVTIAASLARASRNPALEELYYEGPHPGNFAYEVGNPDLRSEHALGLDLSLRWRYSRVSGEVNYFHNAIADFIFRQPTGGVEDGFPVVEFVQADSVLQGVEAHADITLTSTLVLELMADAVRGELSGSGEPLPRMPPFRVRTGLRYQKGAFEVGGEVLAAGRQDRVYQNEPPTAGYGLLELHASYAFVAGRVAHTVTARLDNATNELYRNHLSYLKDFVPEMGRSLKVVYGVRF